MYFDTANYQLSRKDWWLRLRDGQWDLKIPADREPTEDSSLSTQFWELESEALICQRLDIISLPSKEQRSELSQVAAFEAQLDDVNCISPLEADSLSPGDAARLHFQLCANMHTQRLIIVSSRDARITLALDAVTFQAPSPPDKARQGTADFHICELEIMLEDGTTEARRLVEAALEAEVKQLHLDAFPPGRSKLFTYLQQYSPVQYEIGLHRHDDQKLRPLLAEVEHKRQHSSLQTTPPAPGAEITPPEAAGRPGTAQDHASAAPLVPAAMTAAAAPASAADKETDGPRHAAAAVPIAASRPARATEPSGPPDTATTVLESTPAREHRGTGDDAHEPHA